MGRLIDADALKQALRKCQIESLIEHTDEKNVFDIINEQPTACDPKKVVAELEIKFEQTVAEILDKTGSDFTIADFNVKRYSDGICEIVRKGGAE